MPSRRTPSVALVLPAAVVLVSAASAKLAYALSDSPTAAIVVGAGAAGLSAAWLLRRLLASLRRVAAAASGESPDRGGAQALRFSEVADLERALARIEQRSRDSASASLEDRNQLIAALNSGADAVIGIDRDGRVCFANLAAEKLFAGPAGEIRGRPFATLLPSPETMDALQASLASGRREVRIVERPSRQFLEVSASAVAGGGDWAALVVCHDLTDVRRAEQMRRDFVANVSHELRTPLASIRAVLETLESGAMSDATAARDFISRAQTEVDRLTGMVAELLELSRIESGEFPIARDQVRVSRLVTEAAERLQSQADRMGVRLRVSAQPDLPAVLGDWQRLERAVVNLVHNALKFTPAGGEVLVQVREAAGMVLIQVTDSGSGIDERDLPRIFERFYKADNSRRTEGSGLGLALVKHTAEAHGGSVSVASELGRGSIFTISLPAADAGRALAGREATARSAP